MENKTRDAVALLTAGAFIVSGVVYVMQIRGDLDAYIAADIEHRITCGNEREEMRKDINQLEDEIEYLYKTLILEHKPHGSHTVDRTSTGINYKNSQILQDLLNYP